MKTRSGDVGVSLALSNKSTQTCRMRMVNAYWLHRASNGEVIKLVVRQDLDATDYEELDTLLNLNLLREVGLHVHNILWKFRGKQCIKKESLKSY